MHLLPPVIPFPSSTHRTYKSLPMQLKDFLQDRTTLIRRRIDVMVGSPSKKFVVNMKYLQISWELLVTSMVITYPTRTITVSTLSIRSENVNIQMQVRDRNANEHTALKQLGGDFTGRKKKGWRCSLDRISKVHRYRHQKIKLKIKFHLYLSDSCHQKKWFLSSKKKKYVTWGLKSQKFYVYFMCNPMEPFISGVRPYFFKKSLIWWLGHSGCG